MKDLKLDKRKRRLSNVAWNVREDKILLTKWENQEISTTTARKQFCDTNGVELTDKEFVQYALFLGYGLMEDGVVEWPWVIRELHKREE